MKSIGCWNDLPIVWVMRHEWKIEVPQIHCDCASCITLVIEDFIALDRNSLCRIDKLVGNFLNGADVYSRTIATSRMSVWRPRVRQGCVYRELSQWCQFHNVLSLSHGPVPYVYTIAARAYVQVLLAVSSTDLITHKLPILAIFSSCSYYGWMNIMEVFIIRTIRRRNKFKVFGCLESLSFSLSTSPTYIYL